MPSSPRSRRGQNAGWRRPRPLTAAAGSSVVPPTIPRNVRAAASSALLVLVGAAAAVNVIIWVRDLVQGRSGGDFAGYYLAALVGRAHGWAGIYNMGLYPVGYQRYLG